MRWTILLVSTGLTFAQAPSTTLDSPRDFQVFQRQTRSQGTVLATGRTSIDCDRAEGRVGEPQGTWQTLVFDRATGSFRGELRTPAGGWYRFELRLSRAGKPVETLEVGHVGMGEVFVVAGQSNATNYGDVRQQTRSGMVAAFSGREWSIANDPQPGVQDNSKKGSFIPPFGDTLYEKYRVPIGVAAVGHGSTSVRQWLPKGDRFSTPPTMSEFVHNVAPGVWESDGVLFDGMLKVLSALGRKGFRALLWHQGESDAHQAGEHAISAEEYRRLLARTIEASRREAGWDFPWFVAQASYHNPRDRSAPEIRDAQKSLWQAGLALAGPDTDQLTSDNRQNGGLGVHFSDKGLQAHGRLWAEKVEVWLDTVLE
jgi:Carbohydrate esterase, sialic acid-specific acetylesterase